MTPKHPPGPPMTLGNMRELSYPSDRSPTGSRQELTSPVGDENNRRMRHLPCAGPRPPDARLRPLRHDVGTTEIESPSPAKHGTAQTLP